MRCWFHAYPLIRITQYVNFLLKIYIVRISCNKKLSHLSQINTHLWIIRVHFFFLIPRAPDQILISFLFLKKIWNLENNIFRAYPLTGITPKFPFQDQKWSKYGVSIFCKTFFLYFRLILGCIVGIFCELLKKKFNPKTYKPLLNVIFSIFVLNVVNNIIHYVICNIINNIFLINYNFF